MSVFGGLGQGIAAAWDRAGDTLESWFSPHPAPPATPSPAPAAPRPASPPPQPAGPPAAALKAAEKSFPDTKPNACTSCPAQVDYLKPPKGQLTFDAEGNDNPNSPYYSRKPHLPPSPSGVTVGRGLDLSTTKLSKSELKTALKDGGMADDQIDLLAGAHGLNRVDSAAYFEKHSAELKKIELTQKQQYDLFNTTYAKYEADTERLYTDKTSVRLAEKYGSTTAWEDLDASTRDVLVDMRYRGDFGYDRIVDSGMAPGVTENDPAKLLPGLDNTTYWTDNTNIDANRRTLRADYIRNLSK